jgi:hypothetical protein
MIDDEMDPWRRFSEARREKLPLPGRIPGIHAQDQAITESMGLSSIMNSNT